MRPALAKLRPEHAVRPLPALHFDHGNSRASAAEVVPTSQISAEITAQRTGKRNTLEAERREPRLNVLLRPVSTPFLRSTAIPFRPSFRRPLQRLA